VFVENKYNKNIKLNEYHWLYLLERSINMEKRLNTKVEGYVTTFKNDIRNKIISLKLNENTEVGSLLEYIYDYDRLCLDKNDFVKRKRVKNSIPENNRCLAKRANGEQCTRRRKDVEFCGTHSKGTPHGLIDTNVEDIQPQQRSIEVFAQNIRGIVYYIDKYNNVYNTEEIMSNKLNPQVVAKWEKNNDGYSIPEFNI